MSASPNAKEFAQLLLAYEAVSGKRIGVGTTAGFRVCEKLRGALSKLMGQGGFRSLLARAQSLAGAEIPWLLSLEINGNGSLEGITQMQEELNARTVAQGEAALVSHLLALLVTFIGPALTLRLLHDIWPEMEELNH